MGVTTSDYDAYWKEIITALFEDFVQYFLPEVHRNADFSQPPVFLEQELQKLIADKRKKGKAFNDKLVRIRLQDGLQQWLLIHIEVQSYSEADFAERMFSYFYRIYDKYDSRITAIAIYTDDRKDINNTFNYQLFGTEVTYRFNAFSIQQFDERELLNSDNPFALALLAGKYHIQTRKDAKKRYSFKRKLVTLAWEREYDRTKVVALLRFVHLIISLPETLETQFEQEFVKRLINEEEMELTKSQKRIAHTVYEAVYGESLEERDQKLLERSKVEKLAEKTLIAQRLLKLASLNIEQIAEVTDLPISTVKSIQKDLEKNS